VRVIKRHRDDKCYSDVGVEVSRPGLEVEMLRLALSSVVLRLALFY